MENIAESLGKTLPHIQARAIEQFTKVNKKMGAMLTKALDAC